MKKTLIAASVGALLAMASVGSHAANNLLFPYVTTKAGAYTFVSVINDGNLGGRAGNDAYHFNYMSKKIGAASTDSCAHFNANGKTTANDLMQFEVSNKIDMAATFGDTTSTPVYLPEVNTEGFLIIDPAGRTGSSNYKGEATVIDASTGLYYTYTAITTAATSAAPDYSTVAEAAGTSMASWYPTSAVKTIFHILPLGTVAAMTPTNGGGLNVTLTNNEGVTDQNETAFSGGNVAKVSCFGFVAPTQLLQPTTATKAANGGFLTMSGSAPYLQSKIQSSTALGSVFTTISRDIPVAAFVAP